MVSYIYRVSRTERAPVVAVMESIAVVPIPVVCPATVNVPPTRVITPVPRRLPCVPIRTPEPVVDNRSIDVHRLDDIVGAIDVLVAYYLHFHLLLLVLLDIYRGYVLENIFR